MVVQAWRGNIPVRIVPDNNGTRVIDGTGVKEVTIPLRGKILSNFIERNKSSLSDASGNSFLSRTQDTGMIMLSVKGSASRGFTLETSFINSRFSGAKNFSQKISLAVVDVVPIEFMEANRYFCFLFLDTEGNLWTLDPLNIRMSETGTFSTFDLVLIPLGMKVKRMNLVRRGVNAAVLYDESDNVFLLTDGSTKTGDLFPFLSQGPPKLTGNNLFSFYSFGYTALRVEGMFTLNSLGDLYYQNTVVARSVKDFRLLREDSIYARELLPGLSPDTILALTGSGELWSSRLNTSSINGIENYVMTDQNLIGKDLSFSPQN